MSEAEILNHIAGQLAEIQKTLNSMCWAIFLVGGVVVAKLVF